jgi:hypothetical protein
MASSAEIPGVALAASAGDAKATATMRISVARLILFIKTPLSPKHYPQIGK